MKTLSFLFATTVIACSQAQNQPPPEDGTGDAAVPTTDALATCAGTCRGPAPSGWQYVAYAESSRDACPPAYIVPRDVVDGVVAPAATCNCACTVDTQPTCTVTSAVFSLFPSAKCGGKVGLNAVGSSCTSQSVTVGDGVNDVYGSGSVKASALGGACSAPSSSKSVTPATVTHQGRTCNTEAVIPTCADGKQCIPETGSYALCIAKDGKNTCPLGYTKEHIVGDKVTDTRDCSECTCKLTTGCADGTIDLHTDGSCGSTPVTLTANSVCNKLPTTQIAVASADAIATPSASCEPALDFGAIGAATLEGERTVCCK